MLILKKWRESGSLETYPSIWRLIFINFFIKVTKKTIRQQRKAEIIKAFYYVAKREGLENASIAKVAEQAKINPSLVMHYFKTRDELMLSLNHFILDRYLNIYKVNGPIVDSREKLIELIENLFSRKWNRLFDDGVFYSCYAQIYRNKEFKKSFKKLHDSLHQKLQRSLDEAVENRVIDIKNTSEVAENIFALVDGAYYYLGLVDDKEELNRRLEAYKRLAICILEIDTP
jgi:AcrR family transcriptional regulator